MKLRDVLAVRPVEQAAQAGNISPPNPRERYHQAAETIRNECFQIDAVWLLDAHPELWTRICALDATLTQMEGQGATEDGYCTILSQLVSTVRDVWELYESEHEQRQKVN